MPTNLGGGHGPYLVGRKVFSGGISAGHTGRSLSILQIDGFGTSCGGLALFFVKRIGGGQRDSGLYLIPNAVGDGGKRALGKERMKLSNLGGCFFVLCAGRLQLMAQAIDFGTQLRDRIDLRLGLVRCGFGFFVDTGLLRPLALVVIARSCE